MATASTHESPDTPTGDQPTERVKSGAFDVRSIIGTLLGVFGVILLVTALVKGKGGTPPHGDPDWLNLYVSIGLLLAAAVFIVWARVRPLLVPVEEGTIEAQHGSGHGGGH